VGKEREPRFFFLHVMKTGGATFRQHVVANFGPGEVYPDPAFETNMFIANTRIEYLRDLAAERKAKIRAYTGHFPFLCVDMLGIPLVTLTLLRDPVARTISYLRHCKRYHENQHDLSLDEIYDDPFVNTLFIRNHQAKLFCLEASDEPLTYMHVVDVDDARLATAKANLATVDVIGFTEEYDAFIDAMRDRFAWRFGAVAPWHVSDEPWPASEELKRRIADDNAADIEFYEFARGLRSGTTSSEESPSR
jgi:hypothetical protein